MVRGLASHQCGPGSIPGLGVICRLSLLLVLVLAARVFLPGGSPVFRSPQKPTFPNSNSIWNPRATGLSVVRLSSVTLVKQSWFILFYLFIYFKYHFRDRRKLKLFRVLSVLYVRALTPPLPSHHPLALLNWNFKNKNKQTKRQAKKHSNERRLINFIRERVRIITVFIGASFVISLKSLMKFTVGDSHKKRPAYGAHATSSTTNNHLSLQRLLNNNSNSIIVYYQHLIGIVVSVSEMKGMNVKLKKISTETNTKMQRKISNIIYLLQE